MNTHYHVFETTLGFAAIAWNDAGVTRFNLPGPRDTATNRLGGATPAEPPPNIVAVVDQAKRYFAGERIDFDGDRPRSLQRRAVPPLDLRRATQGRFRRDGHLWRACQAGSRERTSRRQRKISASRWRAIPVPLIIPCHRVLAAGGKLGCFSAPGRTETKEKMLALEGVFIGGQPRLL